MNAEKNEETTEGDDIKTTPVVEYLPRRDAPGEVLQQFDDGAEMIAVQHIVREGMTPIMSDDAWGVDRDDEHFDAFEYTAVTEDGEEHDTWHAAKIHAEGTFEVDV
jgi:hypothetical protein